MIDGPEGKHRSDDRREGDGGKIPRNYRWRANADDNFPQVENRLRGEPKRRAGPQFNAPLQPDPTDAKSYPDRPSNNPNIADEVLIGETGVVGIRYQTLVTGLL